MSRWAVVFVVLVATATTIATSGIASAQAVDPAPPAGIAAGSGSATTPAAPPAVDPGVRAKAAAEATARARAAAATVERDAGQRASQRATLAQRYEDELRAIDRQKQQRPSWRRDRELRASLAESLETSRQLADATAAVATAQQRLTAARRTLLAAVDVELAIATTGPHATELAATRTALIAQVGAVARKIVIPDSDIDPLADPEELDQQAAALRDSEAQLDREIAALAARATELHRIVELRRQHDRAGDLALRDDESTHRTAVRGDTRTDGFGTGSGAGGNLGDTTPGHTPPPQTGATPAEIDVTIVLADVVDPSTIDTLGRAQRSGDPGQRADAADHAKAAVATRLAQLQQRRAAIEARAKILRAKPAH